MRAVAGTGVKGKSRWKQVVGAAWTIVVLLAVAVVGLALLGPELRAVWQAPEDADWAFASRSPLANFVNFEAPAETALRAKAQMEEAQKNIQTANKVSLLARNWKYTQNPLADFVLAAINNYLNQVAQALAAFSVFVNAILTAYANFVNAFAQVIASLFLGVNITNISNTSSTATPVSPYR